jgi:hypothetical protein
MGKQALGTFVQSCLEAPTETGTVAIREGNYYDVIPQCKVKTFASMHKPQKNTVKGHTYVLTMSRDLFHKLTVMGDSREIDIDKVLSYTLGPLPYSLTNQQGKLSETTKAQLQHELQGVVPMSDGPGPTVNRALIVDAITYTKSNPVQEVTNKVQRHSRTIVEEYRQGSTKLG